MKKACVIGCFADGAELMNGQTVKTKIVYHELARSIGNNAIMKLDTYGGIKTLIKSPVIVLTALKNAKNIVILPAENGLRVLGPIIVLLNGFYKRKVFYDVIGGWLPSFVEKKKWLKFILKRMDAIYVETFSMKKALENQGLTNIEVIPNCKELKIVEKSNLRSTQKNHVRMCTFSRVMREKGIEDAVKAVINLNTRLYGGTYELDIYGQVDSEQTKWFEDMMETVPEYVHYRGVVPFSKSTEVLKNYDALIFPTFYEGEGFAGTIIDAFAAGLPVVASDWKYNAEIIDHGKTGLIYRTHSIEALEESIAKICNDVDVWNEMKNNCMHEATKYLPSYAMKILIERLQ